MLKRDCEKWIDSLDAADMVYRFFLPLALEVRTVEEFW